MARLDLDAIDRGSAHIRSIGFETERARGQASESEPAARIGDRDPRRRWTEGEIRRNAILGHARAGHRIPTTLDDGAFYGTFFGQLDARKRGPMRRRGLDRDLLCERRIPGSLHEQARAADGEVRHTECASLVRSRVGDSDIGGYSHVRIREDLAAGTPDFPEECLPDVEHEVER